MTDQKKSEDAVAKTVETASKAAEAGAETVKTATTETARTADAAAATTAATTGNAAAAAKKAAPKPKKTAAKAKHAAKKSPGAKPAAAKPSAAKAAADTVKTSATTADSAASAAFSLSNEIGETIAEFVRMRIDDNMDFVNDLSQIESPADLIKAQQSYFEDAAKAYSQHLTALNDKYQDMFTRSFEPFMSGFKEQADQWRRLTGV